MARRSAVAEADGVEESDDRLADVLLERSIARAVVARLDRLGGSPVAMAMISIRLVTPGLSSLRTTSRPESVTAERSFRLIRSGGSRTRTRPRSPLNVVDMRAVGSWRSMIFAPTSP
jgi:hypothetical protein